MEDKKLKRTSFDLEIEFLIARRKLLFLQLSNYHEFNCKMRVKSELEMIDNIIGINIQDRTNR